MSLFPNQRSKFVRKPLGGANRNAGTTAVVPDTDYRNITHLLDTETERNRLLARNGFASDWRSDSNTPSMQQKRTLSAHGHRKEAGVYISMMPHPKSARVCW